MTWPLSGIWDVTDAGNERLARQRLKVDREGLDRRPTESPQETVPVLEEDPQRLGDRQHHLAMRHVEKQRLPHPLAPLLPALGVAGGTKAAGLAGERHKRPMSIISSVRESEEPRCHGCADPIKVLDTFSGPGYPYLVRGRVDSEPEAGGSMPREKGNSYP
jgi:hypothetical protein